MIIRGPDPRAVAGLEERLRILCTRLTAVSVCLYESNRTGTPLQCDDTLGEIADLGESAGELAQGIEDLDTCRCDDPGCPCSGSKWGAP